MQPKHTAGDDSLCPCPSLKQNQPQARAEAPQSRAQILRVQAGPQDCPEEERQGRCWSLYWYSLDRVSFQNEGKGLTSGSSLIISICLFIVLYKYGMFQNLYRSLLNIQILRIPTRPTGSKSSLWEPCLGIASHFSLQKGHYYHISFLLLLKQIVTNLVALINTSLLSHSSQLRIKNGSHTVKTKILAWLSSFLECLGDSLFPVHLCCWQNQFLTMIRLSFLFSCWL